MPTRLVAEGIKPDYFAAALKLDRCEPQLLSGGLAERGHAFKTMEDFMLHDNETSESKCRHPARWRAMSGRGAE